MIEKRNNRPNVWDRVDDRMQAAMQLQPGLFGFSQPNKTEREAIDIYSRSAAIWFTSLERRTQSSEG